MTLSSSRRPSRGWKRPIATIILIACGAVGSAGCAASPVPPAIMSKASLGRVIIYRNGVAFFERHLPPGEKELNLRVPAERVDDFLKSLTIIDDKTGDTMPVSYPTKRHRGDEVEMTIDLPKTHNGLTISYVTESPAWKPSYRLVLSKKGKGKAKLQGWAIVDNVSGEDWKHVRVGVGSTSALSFRYDLHSVKNVHRETLSAGSLLAVAPPTGGAPYDVTKQRGPVVAKLPQGSMSTLEEEDKSIAFKKKANDERAARLIPKVGKLAPNSTRSGRGTAARQMVNSLTWRLKKNTNEKIRIEGYAQSTDDAPATASLERANKLRNRLIAKGVPPEQVEAIGTGKVDDNQEIRVVADVKDTAKTSGVEASGGPAPPPIGESPMGQAHFVSRQAMTIEKGHSAMVSILQSEAEAERVYYYDPISERGSKKFAFNAVRVHNPSKYTLDSGPITVYEDGQFLGEGMAESILPQATAFIPYALDRAVIAEPEVTGREEIERLITIQRGIVSTDSRKIRSTKLVLTNRGSQDAKVFVRHEVGSGYKLSTKGPKTPAPKKLGGAHLFEVKVPAGQTQELTIEEWTPVKRTVDIRTASGIEAISLYLKKSTLDARLKKGLKEVIQRHTERANLQEKIMTLQEQMAVYRTRVDELNIQLVTLKKLRSAAKLRRHLSKKMEEISDLLQTSTMDLADLKAQLMTSRIALQDKLAELTLRDERDSEIARKD
jgi:hypothetical protein